MDVDSSSNNAEESLPRIEFPGKRQNNRPDAELNESTQEIAQDDVVKRKKVSDGSPTSDAVEGPSGSSSEAFPKFKSKIKRRNYRSRSGGSSSDEESPKEGSKSSDIHPETSVDLGLADGNSNNEGQAGSNLNLKESESSFLCRDPEDSTPERGRSSLTSSTDSLSAMDEGRYDASDSDPEDELGVHKVLFKPKPKHKWFITPEIVTRQMGHSNRRQEPDLFQQRLYGSLHVVQRLELMYKLEKHTGCVNSVSFNQSGQLLVSVSDDLMVCLWDWAIGKLKKTFKTCHKSNVFNVKFLPLSGDLHLVTCARDGQVRFFQLGQDGELRSSKRLAQHRGAVHKVATHKDLPHVFLSVGEDARVIRHDVRLPKQQDLIIVKERGRRIPLYSVSLHPLDTNEFLVAGKNSCIRIFDVRDTSTPVSKLCPQHLAKEVTQGRSPNVTSAVYNYNGTEVLGSYNDDDVYLFDKRHSDGCDFVHRYQGHRNNATVKGVSFFGPKSEYIVSGSDCGNIYFWEKESEAIVQWMAGDENGVVNCLEPHPHLPVLATSGLDEDIKIWVPSCEQEPTMEGLKSTVATNMKNREGDKASGYESIDAQMLWIMWRHIRRTESISARNRAAARSNAPGEAGLELDLSTSDSSNSSDEGLRQQCNPS